MQETDRAVEAKPRKYAQHHSVFTMVPPWSGRVPKEFWATPYGSFVRRSFQGHPAFDSDYEKARAYPALDEDYFEWIDLVESVAFAHETYTMLELGAGYGRWAVAAATVQRRCRPELHLRLGAIEAERDHFEMLSQHFLDNGLSPDDHWLLRAAVSARDGTAFFTEGHSQDWWGQSVLPTADAPWLRAQYPDATVVEVPTISLRTILQVYDRVDLIDMEIQGNEAEVCTAAAKELDEKVQRMHIGTHSRDIEQTLESLFRQLGWLCYQQFPCNSTVETDYGYIAFEDGVQTWLNPRFAARAEHGARAGPTPTRGHANPVLRPGDDQNQPMQHAAFKGDPPDESQRQIEALKIELRAEEARIAWFEEHIAELHSKTDEAQRLAAELRAESARADARSAALERDLDFMRKSRSWRVTAPLRWLRRTVSG